jgi:hypothetical protein
MKRLLLAILLLLPIVAIANPPQTDPFPTCLPCPPPAMP